MSTTTDRAAEVLWSAECSDGLRAIMRPDCMLLAQALADAGLLASPEHDLEQRRAGAVEALRSAADEFGAESGLFERWSRGTIAASLRDIAHLVEAGER